MKVTIIILGAIMGFCYGDAAYNLFINNIPRGLGLLAIGMFASVFYIIFFLGDQINRNQ